MAYEDDGTWWPNIRQCDQYAKECIPDGYLEYLVGWQQRRHAHLNKEMDRAVKDALYPEHEVRASPVHYLLRVPDDA